MQIKKERDGGAKKRRGGGILRARGTLWCGYVSYFVE